MDPETFDNLLARVTPWLTKKNLIRKPISAAERLAVTLRYLASGDSQASIGFSYRIASSTICGIVNGTCKAIVECLAEFLQAPSSAEERTSIADDFHRLWQFPNCLGAIDGKHVVIKAPTKSGFLFHNYKGTFCIVYV